MIQDIKYNPLYSTDAMEQLLQSGDFELLDGAELAQELELGELYALSLRSLFGFMEDNFAHCSRLLLGNSPNQEETPHAHAVAGKSSSNVALIMAGIIDWAVETGDY